jgi:hypothetical protein
MDSYLPIIIIVAVAIAIFSSLLFSKKAIIKRKLKKAPLKKISRFRTGDIAKIVGKVEIVGDALSAPLSQRKCAHYHVHIEQQRSSGKNSHWTTLVNDQGNCPFVINDGGFYAFVKSTDLKKYVVQDRKYTSGFLDDAEPFLEKYLKSKGHESENWLGLNKTLRYKEGVLEDGERIAVMGKGKWENAHSLGLPEHYGEVLVIGSMDEPKVYLSDDPSTLKGSKKNRF